MISCVKGNHKLKCSTEYKFSIRLYADSSKSMKSNINEISFFSQSTKNCNHVNELTHCAYIIASKSSYVMSENK